MSAYFLKRILLIIPAIGLVSWLVFAISLNQPDDPLDEVYQQMLNGRSEVFVKGKIKQKSELYHLNKPSFYFAIQSVNAPDTLHHIVFKRERESAEALFYRFKNWVNVHLFRQSCYEWLTVLRAKKDKSLRGKNQLRNSLNLLRIPAEKLDQIPLLIAEIKTAYPNETAISSLEASWRQLTHSPNSFSFYVPRMKWNGWDNQYHLWLSGILGCFDFGASLLNETPVADNLGYYLGYTLRFTLISLLIAYGLAIILGAWLASASQKLGQRLLDKGLIVLDAIPAFWLGTLLLLFFTNPHYPNLNIFPHSYLPYERLPWKHFLSMVLPFVAYVAGMLTVLTRLVKTSLQQILAEDYIRTAKAKGLSMRQIIWKHGLRNALIPLVASLASMFTFLVSGSVIIEEIFNIPGMGSRILQSLLNGDIPAIMMFFSLSAVLTMLGYLLTDLLYQWLDPRIRLQSLKK
ncbi:MAG: ABC transporter permease [Bacteroidota bacterium]